MDADVLADQESGLALRQFLAALRRRRIQILIVSFVLGTIALFVALVLPAVYRSTASILVQEQEIPPDLVRSTITSFADERIQVISQQVMTRAVLSRLIDKYDLYAKYRGRSTTDDIIERMRRDIKIATVNADVSDRSSGHRVNATIAFTISYDSPQPDRAQQVVNELVTLFLNENVKARQQSVVETNAFLAQEADRLARQIQETEAKLAEFKRRNVGRMPDSSTVNVQLAERTEAEIQRVERELSLLHDRKLSMEAQLMLIKPELAPSADPANPTITSSPEDRLRTLQAQFATTSAVYGPDHPDVRRIQREINALRAESRVSGKADTAAQRRTLEAELAASRERYGDDHPDVQRLRRSIAALERSDASTSTAAKGDESRPAPTPTRRMDNPAYVLLASQLEGTKREIGQLTALRDDLRARQRTYDARLLQIPEIEREYSQLTRNYDNAQTRYREVKAKQMQAEGALELEKELKGERFSLGEPANLPRTPFSPNRPAIALIGLIASLGAGLGIAWLRELLDPSIKGPFELARYSSVRILTPIPYIETASDRAAKSRQALAVTGLAIVLVGAFLLGVHHFVRPMPKVVESVVARLPLW